MAPSFALQDQIELALSEAGLVGENITHEIQTVEYGTATICGEYVEGIHVTSTSAQTREGNIDYSVIHVALNSKGLGVRDAVYLRFVSFFVVESAIEDVGLEPDLKRSSWNASQYNIC